MSSFAKAVASFGGMQAPYVEDVFATSVYTGNRAANTIVNGINLLDNGGMTMFKLLDAPSSGGSPSWGVYDSARGPGSASPILETNTSSPPLLGGGSSAVTYNNNGFTLSTDTAQAHVNYELLRYLNYTFRRAPKFFDVITYTGDGSANRKLAHALGLQPGMMWVKALASSTDWFVYHRTMGYGNTIRLNQTSAYEGWVPTAYPWGNIAEPDANTFTVGGVNTNNAGTQYVVYLFAHDPDTSNGIIQCGGYNGGSADKEIVLGYEPQLVLIKNVANAANWYLIDTTRLFSPDRGFYAVNPNTSSQNASWDSAYCKLTQRGFIVGGGWNDFNASGSSYLYMAIRRPNKPPANAASVFNVIARNGTNVNTAINVGFCPDIVLTHERGSMGGADPAIWDRLRTAQQRLVTRTSDAESNVVDNLSSFDANGVTVGADQSSYAINKAASGYGSYINYFFRRAPGFCDVVAFPLNAGANTRIKHSLGVAPELMIVKNRTASGTNWIVYHAGFPNELCYLNLNTAKASASSSGHNAWGTAPASHTATDFGLDGWWFYLNAGDKMIAYLFASLPGISKVGSYSGNGNSQVINCGFSAGARFILIKRVDATGDWLVWDSVRGIIAANDPHLSLNNVNPEVANDDSVDPDASGFAVNQIVATNINVLSGQYIYLAIA